MKLRAENGLIYQKDGDGWTVVASCITGTPQDKRLAEALVGAVEVCRAVKDYLDHPEQKSRRAWNLIGQLEEVLGGANEQG